MARNPPACRDRRICRFPGPLVLVSLVLATQPLRAEPSPRVKSPPTIKVEYDLSGVLAVARVTSGEGQRLSKLGSSREIELLAERAASLMAEGLPRFGFETQSELVLSHLGDLLLTPLTDLFEEDEIRLFVVADEPLDRIPFAALPLPTVGDRESGDSADRRRPVLAERATIVLHVAESEPRKRARSRLASADKLLAIVSDPVYDRDPRLPGEWREPRSEPSSTEASSFEQESRSRSRAPAPPLYGRLVSSAAEARSLLALVPPERSLSLSGFAATQESLLASKLEEFRILHFATHGIAGDGGLSALVLSTRSADGRPVDGLLSAEQIRSWQLTADLVVLSTCNSALDVPRSSWSKQRAGLARAFLDAGAARVLGSLWRVDDLATAELMRRFYQALLEDGLSARAALRRAQLDLRADPRWSAPFYWAGFVLRGDLNRDPYSPI